MNNFNTITKTIAFLAALAITGCASESGDNSNTKTNNNTLPAAAAAVAATSLNQAAYAGGDICNFGHNSIPNIPLSGAPADTDYSRWSMLHDGSTYRL